MQALGSSNNSFYGSEYSTEVQERIYSSQDVGPPIDPAHSIPESPLSRLEEITHFQEDVSQARKDLLVERSKTRSAGDAVRSQRIVTGGLEGQLLNALRKFYNDNIEALPPAITEVYEKIIQERDRLGSIEDDYFEAERTLGGSEWRFMQKEEMLYQCHFPELRAFMDSIVPKNDFRSVLRPPPPPDPVLLGAQAVIVYNAPPPPPPPPPLHSSHMQSLTSYEPVVATETPPKMKIDSSPETSLDSQYKSAVEELETLRRHLDSLRPEQSALLDCELKGFTHAGASEHRVRSQELFEQYSSLLERLVEKEVQVQHLRHKTWESPDQNGDLGRRRSEEWMLNNVKSNSLERKIYFNVLADSGILPPYGESVDEMSERYWFSRMSDSTSDDGQHSIQAVEDEAISNPSTRCDDFRSVRANARHENHLTVQESRQSVACSALIEKSSNLESHGIATEVAAHGTTANVLDGQQPVLLKQNTHSTDLQVPAPILESLIHHRRESNPTILERKPVPDTHGNVYEKPYFLNKHMFVT